MTLSHIFNPKLQTACGPTGPAKVQTLQPSHLGSTSPGTSSLALLFAGLILGPVGVEVGTKPAIVDVSGRAELHTTRSHKSSLQALASTCSARNQRSLSAQLKPLQCRAGSVVRIGGDVVAPPLARREVEEWPVSSPEFRQEFGQAPVTSPTGNRLQQAFARPFAKMQP